MKKKVMALVLGSVMVMGTLAGCGSSNTATETTEVTEEVAETEAAAETEEAEETEEAAEETAETEETATEEETMVEVGGDFPVSTKYAEYQLVDYYIAEMDETPVMVVARTEDQTEYQAHFNFFGDEQLLEFTVDGDTCEVTEDLTGFMAKDIDAIYAAIKESDNWQPVE
ncbi:MAG: hypothetical protein K6B41_15640 [Butyrivibrio sp.]|nr:hypothetical protein [Butyrivibrio sp.]